MTTDLETAAEVIGIGRTLAYDVGRKGTFPVCLVRLGRRVLVPVAELLTFLGDPVVGCDADVDVAADPGRASAPAASRGSGDRRPPGGG